jgi:hypothetical protein
MSKWMVLPVLALAYLVAPAPASAPRDRDHDGLPDKWEQRYGLSTTSNSAKGDPDRDGLRNRREYRLRTSPRNHDTDHDGYGDGVEVRLGKNPRKASSRPLPNPSTTGVPAGWTPDRTQTTDLEVTRPGAVIEDLLLVDADLHVSAPNVTIRRVKLQGGSINTGVPCANGTVIVNTTLEPPPGENLAVESEGAVSYGGYTARGVELLNRGEGFRVAAKSGCGPVRIEDSFVRIATPPGCSHADGIQGYGGAPLTVINATIDFGDVCGTAPFFYPEAQGNTRADIDRLLVMGGGFPFRLGTPGSVSGLKVVEDSWDFGPIYVPDCSLLSHWDARIVRITPDYQVSKNVEPLHCD